MDDSRIRALMPTNSVRGGFTTRRHPASRHDQLIANTQKWVSQTFYGEMLKQMRKSPFRSEVFEGGRGGEAFEEMFDQRLADHMAQSSGSKLVNAIVRKIEHAHGLASKSVVDAGEAYARAMRHQKPIKHHVDELSSSAAPAPKLQSSPHRRLKRITPELPNVAPTH